VTPITIPTVPTSEVKEISEKSVSFTEYISKKKVEVGK
jgi:hypothetical protein